MDREDPTLDLPAVDQAVAPRERRQHRRVQPRPPSTAFFLPSGVGPQVTLDVVNLSVQGLAVRWPEGETPPRQDQTLEGWLMLDARPPLFVVGTVRFSRQGDGDGEVGLRLARRHRALREYVDRLLADDAFWSAA